MNMFCRLLLLSGTAALAFGGSIFITGHDSDFHALLGGNAAGAIKINQVGIGYVTDPAFNVFKSGGIDKFLFVESFIPIPGGHTRGVDGIIASGYAAGTDFEHHDATTLNGELNLLGTKYNAIVVASDYGGTLTAAELAILNTRSADIISFLNAGGGLFAMAEGNGGAGLTGATAKFGYLPFIVSSVPADQVESGYTVTALGASLGLTNSDVNGNFSHNIFSATGGMAPVDLDAQGRILSLATRSKVTDTGVVPEPSTYALFGTGIGLLMLARARRRRG